MSQAARKRRPRTDRDRLLARNRKRREREREALGLTPMSLDISNDLLDTMIKKGRLTADQALDNEFVKIELLALAEEQLSILPNSHAVTHPDPETRYNGGERITDGHQPNSPTGSESG